MTMAISAPDTLRAQFAGSILAPADAGFDDARRVHNGMIDRRPALVARCHGTADVQAAVRFAREHGLEIAVRGGGHNVAGHAVCDGGLMIDLSSMRGVHVDARARRAWAQGGATWGDYNRETQLHGLASTGGVVSSTGVGGLTLGGGLGWLMGKHGMAVDNLRAVELVTAAGEVVRASADEHPDLFWAVRGGGGNFGVATWLEFELHPVGPTVVAGTKLAAILTCHAGGLESGAAAVAPIKSFGTPVMDVIGPMPYTAVNTMVDGGFPKGALNYWKSNFLTALPDAAFDTMIEHFATAPSPMSGLLLEHFHGAATRVGATETAFPHRTVGYNFLAVGEWMDAADTKANVTWTRRAYDAMAPHFGHGRYVNYLNAEEVGDGGTVEAAFGPNCKRLREVKRRYDPDNVFHLNQNVKP